MTPFNGDAALNGDAAVGAPDAAVLVVNWNTRDLLAECLDSLAGGGVPAQSVVVDNASADDSADLVRDRFPSALLLANAENRGFVGGNNQAYAACDPRARYVLLLNSDAALRPGALRTLVDFLDAHPAAGACGPLVLNTDETLQPTWNRFPTVWSEMRGRQDRRFLGASRAPRLDADAVRALPAAQATDWLGGSCLLVRRAAVDGDLGGVLLDPAFAMYSEETDLCLRLKRAGWAVYFVPGAEATHHGGQSSRQMALKTLALLYRSKVLFFRRHYGAAQAARLRAALTLVAGLKWLVLGLRGRRGREAALRQQTVVKAMWGGHSDEDRH